MKEKGKDRPCFNRTDGGEFSEGHPIIEFVKLACAFWSSSIEISSNKWSIGATISKINLYKARNLMSGVSSKSQKIDFLKFMYTLHGTS